MRISDLQNSVVVSASHLRSLWGLPEVLTEATYKEVAAMIDPNFLKQKLRVQDLRSSVFDRFEPKDIMHFNVRSSEYVKNGLIYDNQVKFLMWDEIMSHDDLNVNDRSRLLLWYSDIQIRCDCPSFQYHYAYAATQKGVILPPEEDRPSDKTNPNLRGLTCKHLTKTMRVLPFNSGHIASQMKQVGTTE